MIQAALSRRLAFLCVLMLILAAASGCGSGFATVEGTVTVDGKSANDGTVIFSDANNRSAVAPIGPDGSYHAERVPVGPVKVVIHQMMIGEGAPVGGGPLKGIPAGGGPLPGIENLPPVADPVRIPPKYQNVETSGLTCTVKNGLNEFNIELSSR